jgi:hypothetical protein
MFRSSIGIAGLGLARPMDLAGGGLRVMIGVAVLAGIREARN